MISRTIVWWSTGAASAVAAGLMLRRDPKAIIVRCETNNEDPDNYRFEADVMRFINHTVTLLKSEKYGSVWEVWQARRYMAGINGAPCTVEMKLAPRLAFQKPTDTHVFGYTADARDVERFNRLKANYPELKSLAAMGFPNANCLQTGCVKATSPDYWALYRQRFPEAFARTAAYAREIGARLTRISGERAFIDEIPYLWPTTNPIVPTCDFLCHIAEIELANVPQE